MGSLLWLLPVLTTAAFLPLAHYMSRPRSARKPPASLADSAPTSTQRVAVPSR